MEESLRGWNKCDERKSRRKTRKKVRGNQEGRQEEKRRRTVDSELNSGN